MKKHLGPVVVMLALISLAGPTAAALRPHAARPAAIAGFTLGRAHGHDAVAGWLGRLSRALDAMKPEENALAALLDADKPEEVRESEERLARHREPAPVGRMV